MTASTENLTEPRASVKQMTRAGLRGEPRTFARLCLAESTMGHGVFRNAGKRVWRCWVRLPDGTRRACSTRQTDELAARIAARRMQREAADPAMRQAPPAPLSGVLSAYLASRAVSGGRSRRGCAAATIGMYTEKCKQLRAQLGGDRDAAGLRLRDLEAYVVARRKLVTDHTIAKELGVLRAALRRARRDGAWAGDLDCLMPEFSPGYVPRTRYLAREEYAALVAALSPVRGGLVAFLVMTGARNGEWQAVALEHVDLAAGLLTLPGTKTERAHRAVPIPGELRPLLEQLTDRPVDLPGDRLFRPWSNIRRDLARACTRAGLASSVTPNDLRRTYATWLRLAGVPIDRIARLLGHRDSRMVERVYGQLGPQGLAGDVAGVFPTGSVR